MEENLITPGSKEVTFEGSRLLLVLMVMIIPFYLAGDLVFSLIWRNRQPALDLEMARWIKFLIIIAAIFVHELIHGLVFAFYAPNGFRSVKFGFSRTMGSPYCHCTDAIKVKHYRCAGIAPFIILGVIPLAFAMLTGVNWIKIFGLLLCIGGFGDVLVWLKLLKYESNLLVRDHPEKMGFIIEG